jgi:ElaB/YqjD/DUF883 family membrane-anchored ribosome-binding protein
MATTDQPLTNRPITPETSRSVGIRNRMSNVTSQFRNTAADFGRSTATTLDRNIDNAAGALQRAAETLRNRAGTGEGKVNHFANTTADKLETTARYFRDHHTQDMVKQAEDAARRRPGMAIGIALGVGFLLGMALKRDRRYY